VAGCQNAADCRVPGCEGHDAKWMCEVPRDLHGKGLGPKRCCTTPGATCGGPGARTKSGECCGSSVCRTIGGEPKCCRRGGDRCEPGGCCDGYECKPETGRCGLPSYVQGLEEGECPALGDRCRIPEDCACKGPASAGKDADLQCDHRKDPADGSVVGVRRCCHGKGQTCSEKAHCCGSLACSNQGVCI